MAAIAPQSIELDLTPGGVSPFLYVSQGDFGLRSLVFYLKLNGQDFTIPYEVTTVSLEGITKTGNAFNVTCSFTGSTVTSPLTIDMTTDIGMDICQILLKNEAGEKLGSANFFIVVEQSPSNIRILYGSVYWSDLAKSWAVGGTDLRSDEETNNSYYWSTVSREFSELSEKLGKSWAVGGTGIRHGEDTDNAKYYSNIVNDVRPQIDENTNDISVLQSLIDQYVTPSAQHPDEVVNARVGFDGTTYQNLGDAIRSQVTVFGYIPGSEEAYIRFND